MNSQGFQPLVTLIDGSYVQVLTVKVQLLLPPQIYFGRSLAQEGKFSTSLQDAEFSFPSWLSHLA